jgi:hypothetical protein
VLEAIFSYVSRDEAAHAGFYRAMIQLELSEDRDGTIADLAHVISRFKMPGDGLIPNYQERLRTSGAGISTRLFVEHGLLPTLRTLGTSRNELKCLRERGTGDDQESAHNACQPDGRSCGRVRVNLTDAVRFLEKAGKSDPIALLAKTQVDGGTSVQVNITRHQHGSLFVA